MINWITC